MQQQQLTHKCAGTPHPSGQGTAAVCRNCKLLKAHQRGDAVQELRPALRFYVSRTYCGNKVV
jgi:hypothetical protein